MAKTHVPGGDLGEAERIRAREVSRVLAATDLSAEEVGELELMSRSLVEGVLRGPMSATLARAAGFSRPVGTPAPRGTGKGT